MTRVSRWCTLAGITAGLLGLAVPASAATGWTVVTPPASTAGAELTGSYALSDTDAWVVGGPANASAAPVALNWNGTAWSSVPTPTPSGSTPEWALKSVAASSASDAWAVGEQSSGKIHDSLYEHWNGTAWSVAAGPNEGILNAVLDFSPANAWAFADFSVLHWNGTTWSVVSGALPALAVSADGPDDIWGIYRNDQVTQAVLLANWNGSSWTTSPSPIPADSSVSIGSAASSPSHVWLFGTDDTTGEPMILSHS